MARRKPPSIPDQLLDQLLAGGDPRDTLAGKDGLLDALKKALAERALNAEMDHHLKSGEPDGRPNTRNGYGCKTVLTDTGRMELEVPRDRLATFDPQLVAKYRRRLPGFDEKVVSLYARGLSVRQIQGHLRELYGSDASPDLVSAVTDAVRDEVATWQERPLEPLYALVFFDALRVKVRDEGTVRNKAVHMALGVRPDGTKEVLGLWIEQTEGAKFWLRVMTELKTRGVEDVLIAIVDGLKGFPEAITAVFPDAQVQTCIVHLLRHSLDFVSDKDRKAVAAVGSWRRAWPVVIPSFAFPEEVRRIVYTTNAIESLNAKLRRAVRARGHFPSDEAATKLLFLVLNLASKDWKMPPRQWGLAKAQLAILFGDRFRIA